MEKFWNWLKKAFHSLGEFFSQHVAPMAVTVTNVIKHALDSGELGFIAKIVDGLTGAKVGSEIIGVIKLALPKVLAFELAIQGLPTNPTEADIEAFEQRVLDAFQVHFQKDKVYTTLTAQIILEVKALLGDGKISFAEAVQLAEDIYQKYKEDLAEFGE